MDDNSARDVRLQLVDHTGGAVFLVCRLKMPLRITKIGVPAVSSRSVSERIEFLIHTVTYTLNVRHAL